MKKQRSLKWKIAKYLLCFAAALIALLYVFQVVLLEPMYEKTKVRAVKETGDEIAKAINDSNLDEVILSVSMQNDISVTIDDGTNTIIYGNPKGMGFARLDKYQIEDLVYDAATSKDHTNVLVSSSAFTAGERQGDSYKNIYYTRVIDTGENPTVLYIYSTISPIDATTKTLTLQLIYISVIILASVAILTFVMNERLAGPLIGINNAAKRLSEGSYSVDEKTNKYSEAQELNRTLEKAAEDIQKADKAKRDLIANVSHDLRTPLTMISGYGEMMRDLPGEKTDENLQVIINESQRLNSLVNDLLDLSRLEENRIVLYPEVFDITEMLDTQLKKYAVYEMQDGYRIEKNLCGHVNILADRKRIEQVFNNFMINAINYSGDAKHIIVTEEDQGNTVRISIRDFGEGIERDKLKDIWDRYYKIDKTHVRVQQGSGIGLSIVKQILELHKVNYGVDSELGKGSVFWFEFPSEKV